nr:MAG: hypothetical protein 1 [Leviviridae sp.]
MAKVRTRSSSGQLMSGTISWLGSTNYYSGPPSHSKWMEDVVGSGYPHIKAENWLHSISQEVTFEPLNGQVSVLGYPKVYSNAPPAWCRYSYNSSHLGGLTGSFRDIGSVLANTNPSRPSVDIPVALAELREIPSLIRQTAKTLQNAANLASLPSVNALRRRLANAKPGDPSNELAQLWLMYNFGYRPLVQDLMTISGLVPHVAKRCHEIVSHSTRDGSLRYYRKLGSMNGTITGQSSSDTALDMTFTKTTVQRKWLTARWVSAPDPLMELLQVSQANRVALAATGLNISLSSFWEAMPWSWLIDWFGGLGDLLMLRRNVVGYRHMSAALMTHTDTYTKFAFTKMRTDGITGGAGQVHYETKQRTSIEPLTLIAKVPVLGASRIATLAALTQSRTRASYVAFS